MCGKISLPPAAASEAGRVATGPLQSGAEAQRVRAGRRGVSFASMALDCGLAADYGSVAEYSLDRVTLDDDHCLAWEGAPAGEGDEEDGDEEEEEEEEARARARMVANAKSLRAARAREGLLEGYISLERATHAALGDENIRLVEPPRRPPRKAAAASFTDDDGSDDDGRLGGAPVRQGSSSASSASDDDNDSAEEGGRVHTTVHSNADDELAELARQDGGGLAADEKSEELSWEVQQIRKGTSIGGGRGGPAASAVQRATGELVSRASALATAERLLDAAPVSVRPLDEIARELEAIRRAAEKEAAEAEQVLCACERELTCVAGSVRDAQAALAAAQEEDAFYREMLGYLEALSDMLSSIGPAVAALFGEWVDACLAHKRRAGEEAAELAKVEKVGEAEREEASNEERSVSEARTAFERPSALEAARRGISERLAALIKGISPDYIEGGRVWARLFAWSEAFPEGYLQAFVEEMLPEAFSVFTLIAAIGWSPLDGKEAPPDGAVGQEGRTIAGHFAATIGAFGASFPASASRRLFVAPFLSPIVRDALGAAFDVRREEHCRALIASYLNVLTIPEGAHEGERIRRVFLAIAEEAIGRTPARDAHTARQLADNGALLEAHLGGSLARAIDAATR